MAGDEDIWDLVDKHVVLMFWGKWGVSPVGWCKVSFLQHEFHDLGWLVIVQGLNVCRVIKKALSMVGQDVHSMQ